MAYIYVCVCLWVHMYIWHTEYTQTHIYFVLMDGNSGNNGNNKFFYFLKKYTIILTKEKTQQFCTSRNFF